MNPFGYEKKEYFGYKVCLYVNAKNRMGGYTGRLLHFLMIKNGTVILSATKVSVTMRMSGGAFTNYAVM